MTLGTQNLRDQITIRLAASPSGLACCQLEGARDILACASVESVVSVAALPNAATNQGRWFFVESICAYRYSNGLVWTNDYDTTLGRLAGVGCLLTWGINTGDPTVSLGGRSVPGTTAGGGTNWCQVSMGDRNGVPNHASAVKFDGTLWTWGSNTLGQLGNGTITARSSPGTTAGGGTTWCQGSAGSNHHTAAIKTDGTLWTWGGNTQGALGDGTTTSRSSPGTTVAGGTTWCAASAGAFQTSAVKTDGTLWTWGCNGSGRLGNGDTINRSSPGTTAGGGTNWCSVDSTFLGAAVKTDGTLWTWGINYCGALGDGSTVNRSSPGTTVGGGSTWCSASPSGGGAVAVKTDGTAWTWGSNTLGQLGNGTITARSSPGTTVGGGLTWCTILGGQNHTGAVKTDGTLWTWGGNTQGALGDGTTTSRSSPGTTVAGGTTWCAVSSSFQGTAGIRFSSKGFDQP